MTQLVLSAAVYLYEIFPLQPDPPSSLHVPVIVIEPLVQFLLPPLVVHVGGILSILVTLKTPPLKFFLSSYVSLTLAIIFPFSSNHTSTFCFWVIVQCTPPSIEYSNTYLFLLTFG